MRLFVLMYELAMIHRITSENAFYKISITPFPVQQKNNPEICLLSYSSGIGKKCLHFWLNLLNMPLEYIRHPQVCTGALRGIERRRVSLPLPTSYPIAYSAQLSHFVRAQWWVENGSSAPARPSICLQRQWAFSIWPENHRTE